MLRTGRTSDLLVAYLCAAHHRFGSRDRAAELYYALEQPEGALAPTAFAFAFVHLLRGDTDAGLQWLAKSRDAHDALFVCTRVALKRLNVPIADAALAQMTAWGIQGIR